MNAKHSLFTSRVLLLLAGAVLCAPALHGQEIWHESRNVAGLAADTTGRQAEARLFGKFTSGDFRTWSEGEHVWTAGAAAKAETQLKDFVMVGNFGFTQEEGSGMMGSMFTKPGYYPVDVLEFTPGRKSRQTYDISGGLAWKNGSRWTPGIYARFQGINYAKRKDLRHTTYRQELELVPSILYEGTGWRAGASLIYGKNSEFIQAEQIGPAKAESYYAFLDKGLRYGSYQAWDGSGIHLQEPGVDRFPVSEHSWGGALQLSLGERFFAQLEYTRSQGEVGEKGYTWFRFPRRQWAALLQYTYAENGNLHRLGLEYTWRATTLDESVIEKVTSGGVTTPSVLGSNRVYSTKALDAQLTYTLESADGLVLEALLAVDQSNQLSTLLYPYMDQDDGTHLFFGLSADIPMGPRWQLKTGLLMGGGAYSEQMSKAVTDPMNITSTPFRLTDWFDLEQEVSDALRVQLSLALRYRLRSLPLYVEAGFEGLRALENTLVPGLYRQTTYLQLGYNF